MKIFSFSIKPSEHKTILMLARIKQHCMKTGISFSSIIINAIKDYNIEGFDKNGK